MTAVSSDRPVPELRVTPQVLRWLYRFTPYLILIAFSLTVLFPVVWMVLASLKTQQEIFLHPLALPRDPQWRNYIDAAQSGFPVYVLNSVIVTVGAVIPMVLVSVLAAYGLARREFFGRRGIYVIVVLAYAIPFHAVLVPLYTMVDSMGLLNTHLGLILPNIALGIPFSVVILYAFFLDFPQELEEAARLDGCGPARVLFSIVLPLSGPAVLSVIIFQSISVWNEFLWASIATSSDDIRPWTAGIMQFQGEYASDWPRILAVISAMMVPLLIVYIAAQKHFVRAFAGMGK